MAYRYGSVANRVDSVTGFVCVYDLIKTKTNLRPSLTRGGREAGVGQGKLVIPPSYFSTRGGISCRVSECHVEMRFANECRLTVEYPYT
jgi:hypothetical protein